MSHFNGEALRKLRKEKNLTQTDVSKVFFYTPMTIHNWETETKLPSFDTVVELANYFGVSIEVFVK
jgi:transcriptional regulator with XRE-family HTH domain